MKTLPDDAISCISQFLSPTEFYNLKTAITHGGQSRRDRDDLNRLYWWRHELTLERAVIADCPSLTRWVVREDADMTVGELLASARVASSFAVQVALFDQTRARWGNTSDLTLVWIEIGSTRAFTHVATCASRDLTVDTFDHIYLHSRWYMLAIAFQFSPKQFIRWTFGDYTRAADPELILNLRFVLHHLDQPHRETLITILKKYHEWLWKNKLDDAATISTISAIHQLEVSGTLIVPFEKMQSADEYLELAITSPHPEFLEYLLMSGLEVEPHIFSRTRNLEKLRLLATAQIVQKFQKIMVMMIVLVAAVVTGIFINKNTARQCEPAELIRPARSKNYT